jgi:aryl-alcohol dehydrogenase-like predicted oxidoreductase
LPWSPLAGGVLAGSREAGTTRSKSANWGSRYDRPADEAVMNAVKQVAAARGETPAQVAIAWVLAQPGVTAPILGATKLAQLDDPLKAVDAPLSAEECAILEAPYEPQKMSTLPRPSDPAAGAPRKRSSAPA